jgi:tight adherence protein B
MNLIVPAIFVGVVAIVLLAYWTFVLRVDQAEDATLQRRLQPDPGANIPKKLRILKPTEKMSSVEQLDSILGRLTRFTSPIQRDITQAGLNITVGTLLLSSACLAVGGFLLVRLLTIYNIIAVTVGFLLSFVPFIWLRYKKNSRLRKFEEQFPEAIDLIGRALRAGHAFTTGLAMAAEEIPAPVGEEFKLLYDRQNFGMPLPEAMKAFAARIPIIDARFFVTAVLTQRETGGNLGEVLDNLASVIRDRFRVKRQVRVLTAHGRITGWILAGLPPALALVMMVTSPGHLDAMITDPLGIQMIIVALVLQVLGTLIIRKLVDIPY